jgi:hypothetical protein
MGKKIKIGDVIEIPTKFGNAYAQFAHYHKEPPRFGALLRVIPGYFDERPKSLGEIVAQKESFWAFFPLQAAVNRNIFSIVANEPVPPHAQRFPFFRAGNRNPRTGRVDKWWLWDGVKAWKLDKLNDEQLDLPIKAIWNDTLLISRIEQGWTPRKAEAFVQAARLRNQVQQKPALVKGIRHFLLFKDRTTATQAKQLIEADQFESELVDDGTGFSVIVRQGAPFTDEYIENVTVKLTEIARKSAGTYDAWETVLGK